jgi:cation diffusion facilitator CzcD-associated flavoprotein CzcO
MSVSRAKQTVVVVGAGPYGLATTSHLAAAGVSVRVFGEPMDSWSRHMPEGMLLRSRWQATHIANPHRLLSLDHFRQDRTVERLDPIPLALFI